MSYRIFPVLLISISLSFFFLYLKIQNNTEASEKETALIEKLQELKKHLEDLQATYEKSGIETQATLNDKEQKLKDKHPKVKNLHQSLTSVLADPTKVFQSKNKANAKEADGGSLKKKEDIGKKTFVDEILAWAASSIKELQKLAKDDTPILIKELKKSYLAPLNTTHAINKHFYDEICKALPDNLEPATRATASAKIINYLSNLTKADLEKLFKENKTIRQDLADDKSLKCNILPTPSTLYDVLILLGVEDKENENHPKKIAEAEKTKTEAEKERAEFEKDYNQYMENLRGAVNNIKIQNLNEFFDTLLADLPVFFENFDNAVVGAAKSGKPTIESMRSHLKSKFEGKLYCELQDLKDELNNWTNQDYIKTDWYAEQYTCWKTDKRLPSYNLIAAAIHDSYIPINTDTLLGKLSNWTEGVKGAFVFEKIFKIDIKKAEKNLAELFSESVGGISTDFIYTKFISTNLSGASNPSTVKDLGKLVWEGTGTMAKVIDKTEIETFYLDCLNKNGPYAVKKFSDALDTILPDFLEIQQALRLSAWQTKSLVIPDVPNATLTPKLRISSDKWLSDGKILGDVLIEIEYKNIQRIEDDKVEDVLYVVPSSAQWSQDFSLVDMCPLELIDNRLGKVSVENTTSSRSIKLKFKTTTIEKRVLGILKTNKIIIYEENGRNLKIEDIIRNLKALNITGIDYDNFIKKYTTPHLIDIELIVKSSVEKNKQILVSAVVKSNTPDWNVVFDVDGSTILENNKHYSPTYQYK